MKMYDSVLARVRKIEHKYGISYADTDSGLYKTAKVFLIISFVYAMLIKSMYFLAAGIPNTQVEITTPAICTAIMAAGFVLLLFGVHIIGLVLSAVPSVTLLFIFGRILTNETTGKLNLKFYWAHLIPLAIFVICAIVMTIVAVRAKYKLKKMYDKVIGDIYLKYSVSIAKGEDIDEEKWNEFLGSFNPFEYNKQFVKEEER